MKNKFKSKHYTCNELLHHHCTIGDFQNFFEVFMIHNLDKARNPM